MKLIWGALKAMGNPEFFRIDDTGGMKDHSLNSTDLPSRLGFPEQEHELLFQIKGH